MGTQEFNNRIEQFQRALLIELPRINESIALNAIAQVKDRIINDGKNSKGASLGTYSKNELPLFFYKGKSLNSGGEEAIAKAKKAGKGLSYNDFREANNRPTDHITTNFSGQMWKDVGVVKQIEDGGKTVTTVAAKNTINRTSGNKTIDTDTILSGNADRYGDIFEVSTEEEKRLANTYDYELQKLIDIYF